MYFYSAYGYKLASEIQLSCFTEINRTNVNISINTDSADSSFRHHSKKSFSITKLPNGILVTWPDVASYEVLDGSEVIIHPVSEPLSILAKQPLYGVIIAALLQQKEHYVLHGSAVDINGRTVVLVGKKGLGKSTLSACLLARGHTMLTDDVTALSSKFSDSTPLVLPGIPRIKLWPDAVDAAGYDPETLPLAAPEIRKHVLHASESFKDNSAPLHSIIMLDHADETEFKEMNKSEKMIWLLGGQYLAKFNHAFPKIDHERYFRYSSLLAQNVNIIKMVTPRNISLVPDFAELIEEYVLKN